MENNRLSILVDGHSSSSGFMTAVERTVPDLQLAEALGFEQPLNIRKLIRRHHEALEAMGVLSKLEKTSDERGGRPTTEYHLTRPQAAFIIGKARTKRAVSLAILMAEVFAMFTEGRLVAVDDAAATDLQAAVGREVIRQGIIAAEEREARADAFAAMKRGRCRGRRKPPSLTYAAAASW